MKRFGRRRRLLIDKLQLKLLAINLVYTMAMVLVFVVVIFGPLVVTILDDSSGVERKLYAADRMLLLHKSTWPAVIIVALLFSCHSILYTHRIAGPLYQFRRVLGKVGTGDLTVRAGIRSKDYLETESAVINRMIEGLIDRACRIRDAADGLSVCTVEAERLRRSTDTADLGTVLDNLESKIDSLLASVDGFRLPGPEPSPQADPRQATESEPERCDVVHS